MIEKVPDEELDKVNGGSSNNPPVKPRIYTGYSPEQNNNSLNNGDNETLKGLVAGKAQVVDGNCIA